MGTRGSNEDKELVLVEDKHPKVVLVENKHPRNLELGKFTSTRCKISNIFQNQVLGSILKRLYEKGWRIPWIHPLQIPGLTESYPSILTKNVRGAGCVPADTFGTSETMIF